MKTSDTIIIFYSLVTIMTFGHGFKEFETESRSDRVAYSVVCAVLHPLYWSVKLWEGKK